MLADDALLEYVKQLSASTATDPDEMSSVKSEPLYGQVKVLMVCGFDIIFFFRDLSEMISSLRREHLKRHISVHSEEGSCA